MPWGSYSRLQGSVLSKGDNEMSDEKTRIIKNKIIVSAIGTGGHYFPAVVVAEALAGRGADVIVLVRKGFREEEVARKSGLKTFAIKARGFYGKSMLDKVLAILVFVYSSYVLLALMKGARGIAFGGFGTLPLVTACLIKRRDFFLFEPNRKAGRATKLFSSKAKTVFLGLPILDKIKGRLCIAGVPIRPGFKTVKKAKISKKRSLTTILFLGGSGGAYMINKLALDMQRIIPDTYRLTIISGRRDYDWMLENIDDRTRLIPFTFTPWSEMSEADVIVARAGALAGYEILATKTPVLFIPFPYAIDDHQYHNAEYFAGIGNAHVLTERQITGEKVMKKIKELLKQKIKKPYIIWDAEKQIADEILGEQV